MQIVINIPEEIHFCIIKDGYFFDNETNIIRQAIKNGTPLPNILDKIRAEIEAKCCITVGRENDGAITLHDVFEIIDKYKAESEKKTASINR